MWPLHIEFFLGLSHIMHSKNNVTVALFGISHFEMKKRILNICRHGKSIVFDFTHGQWPNLISFTDSLPFITAGSKYSHINSKDKQISLINSSRQVNFLYVYSAGDCNTLLIRCSNILIILHSCSSHYHLGPIPI